MTVRQPHFVSLPDVRHTYQGRRAGGLEGAIVHYDAGRARSSKQLDDLEWGAINTLKGAEKAGFAYVTVSRGGTVYLPANMDWGQWGSHAGKSKCPATGRAGVSRFYVGIEVNSPGLVLPTADPGLFVPWFEAVRDKSGAPVLDRQGRARIKNPSGEIYTRDQIAMVTATIGTIRKGAYVPFTLAQREALIELLLWLKREHAAFRLDRVFGHDEVAPTRKLDPGGCLTRPGEAPVTMAAFRKLLLERAAVKPA